MYVPDRRLKTLKKYDRPYFSPVRGSYEMDRVFPKIKDDTRIQYLFIININTRFLTAYPLITTGETGEVLNFVTSCIKTLNDSLPPDNKITNIRSDADRAFGWHQSKPLFSRVNVLSLYLGQNNITLNHFSSDQTNRNRIVDRVIRTIRDKLITNRNFTDYDLLLVAIEEYNNTKHSAFGKRYTPNEVQNNPDLEEVFIRDNMYRLEEVKKLQRDAGFFNYKPENILLVSIDYSKRDEKMLKKRRLFNRIALFKRYENGNVMCEEINGIHPLSLLKTFVIPIQFTKLISQDIDTLPKKYFNFFSE
jgi:hypothetical protein